MQKGTKNIQDIVVQVATDHAGFAYKEALTSYFTRFGITYKDHGAVTYDDQDDYPDFILPLAKEVSRLDGVGIIFGGSGQGEAIVANRVPGVRAVVYQSENLESVVFAREHNNANVLSIGARFISQEAMIQAVTTFLQTPFSDDERHIRRIAKIDYEI